MDGLSRGSKVYFAYALTSLNRANDLHVLNGVHLSQDSLNCEVGSSSVRARFNHRSPGELLHAKNGDTLVLGC